MDFITFHTIDSIAIIELNRGATNAINLTLVDECTELVYSLAGKETVEGLILSSASERFFSIGFDVPALYPLAPDEFEKFYKRFNRLCLALYALPMPTVAAISGHATGGGCILALCCDFRVMSEGHKLIGLPEITLGVPVPFPADRMLRQLLGDREASRLMYSGEFIPAAEAQRIGLVDEVVESHELRAAAKRKIETVLVTSLSAFATIKGNRIYSTKMEIEQMLVEKESLFIDMWYSGEARTLLKKIFGKY